MYHAYQTEPEVFALIERIHSTDEPRTEHTNHALRELLNALIANNLHLPCIRLLAIDLSHRWDATLLPYACKHGEIELVRLLLSTPTNPEIEKFLASSLENAIGSGHIEIVALLLAEPRLTELPQPSALTEAIQNDQLAVLDLLLADPRIKPNAGSGSALMCAANAARDAAILRRLVADDRVNLRIHKDYILKATIMDDHQDAMVVLVEAILSRQPDEDQKHRLWKQMIPCAAKYSRYRSLEWLIERSGIEPGASEWGLLWIALDNDDHTLIRHLWSGLGLYRRTLTRRCVGPRMHWRETIPRVYVWCWIRTW